MPRLFAMAAAAHRQRSRCSGLLLVFFLALSCFAACARADPKYIYGTGVDGITRQLAVDRYPSLYTEDFGDCLGGQSLFNITKFDAAYYADNMTVLFHLDGSTNIRNESLMMVITMDAYGETRYTNTFNPCLANMYSLCPLNASVPITGYALFGVGPAQVGGIPSIAFTIPDFEGVVRIQIFANSTETEIGCFQAAMTNGNSFGHPEAIGSILGIFMAVAMVASAATAMYGASITHMRTHYAHSFSVLLIIETFQSIFFSGALSLAWPSVLVAWWSNFAWSAGLVYNPAIVKAVSPFAGITGNASQVGGAGSTIINNQGGLASQIYGRSLEALEAELSPRDALPLTPELSRAGDAVATLVKRKAYNASNPYDYTWGGDPVTPGMPLPGTFGGFAGELSIVKIPAADAFIVALIWLVVTLGLVALTLVAFKWMLEGLAKYKFVRADRLSRFRSHYLQYTGLALLRTLFIAFFAVMTLAVFQFATHKSIGATVIAAVVCAISLFGMGGAAWYACHFRLRYGSYSVEPDAIIFAHTRIFKVIPFILPTRSSTLQEKELAARPAGRVPFFRIAFSDDDPARKSAHQDEGYIKRFGWLSARYRRSKWWFFAYYLGYQFFRAIIIGGGGGSPIGQVYALFVYEIVAFVVIAKLSPFEGSRNTALAVWMLSISKIVTAGVSIGLLPAFDLGRILVTALGVIIIVVQGLVVIAVMILVVLGAISSWMSLSRNREEFEPEYLDNIRLRYFEKMDKVALDDPAAWKSKAQEKERKKEEQLRREREREEAIARAKEIEARGPYFSVNQVRRNPKIEDEDGDVVAEIDAAGQPSSSFDPNRVVSRASRTNSISSRRSVGSLPRGARPHRTSWSAKDFAQWDASVTDFERSESALRTRRSMKTIGDAVDEEDDDEAAEAPASAAAPLTIRPAVSRTSLRENGSHPSSPRSPTNPKTPTRETLDRHAEERFTSVSPPPPVAN